MSEFESAEGLLFWGGGFCLSHQTGSKWVKVDQQRGSKWARVGQQRGSKWGKVQLESEDGFQTGEVGLAEGLQMRGSTA